MARWIVVVGLVAAGCSGDPEECEPGDDNCDGTIDASEGFDCPDCMVVCVDSAPPEPIRQVPSCRDARGVRIEGSAGFRCSSSDDIEDHEPIFIDCSTGEPRCIREAGDPLPTDLEFAECVLRDEP